MASCRCIELHEAEQLKKVAQLTSGVFSRSYKSCAVSAFCIGQRRTEGWTYQEYYLFLKIRDIKDGKCFLHRWRCSRSYVGYTALSTIGCPWWNRTAINTIRNIFEFFFLLMRRVNRRRWCSTRRPCCTATCAANDSLRMAEKFGVQVQESRPILTGQVQWIKKRHGRI